MCTTAERSYDAVRNGASAVARIDCAVTVDGAGDNDAARVVVATDRLNHRFNRFNRLNRSFRFFFEKIMIFPTLPKTTKIGPVW